MKLQLESYNIKYTVETANDDLNIEEYVDILIGILHQAGFHKTSIEEAIISLADTYKE
jgi:hypothetical protein